MNLYEILEVSENASLETINKIYKIQAKRYHPDLQENDVEKAKAEEKMKQINDAYSVLSDEQKRKEYDEKLKQERIIKKQEDEQNIINNMQQKYAQNQANNINNMQTQQIRQNKVYTNSSQNKNYNNSKNTYTEKDYIRDYNKKLRKFKMQLTRNKIKENIITLLIMVIIAIFIWFFPPSHKFIIKLYEENVILQALVEIIVKIFNALKQTFFG